MAASLTPFLQRQGSTDNPASPFSSMSDVGVVGHDADLPHFRLEKNIMIPMRDGVRLAGDLFLPPVGKQKKFPCILIRTPYDKELEEDKKLQHHNMESSGQYWTSNGYALYIQDCRGRFQSEGEFYKYVGEANDGYDTVQWLAGQDWSDGNVGTAGVSYLCHVQTSMAVLRPPALKAMFCIKGGFFNAYHSGVRYGGALEFRQWVWTFKTAPKGAEAHRDPLVKKALMDINWPAWLTKGYPFTKGLSPLSMAPSYERFMFDMTENGCYTDYWKQMGLNTEVFLEEFADIPTVYLTGWYDIYARSTCDFFTNLHGRKKQPIHLIVGAWGHHAEGTELGDIDFGKQADIMYMTPHLYDMERVFFDSHLKHITGEHGAPAVRYFRMGGGDGHKTEKGRMMHGGQWFQAERWPPADSQMVLFYMREDGQLKRKPKPPVEGHVPAGADFSVASFLANIGLAEYAESFEKNKVDQNALIHLADDGNASLLAELVGPIGDRAKLRAGVQALDKSFTWRHGEFTSYEHNPSDPVPSIGGNLFTFQNILLVGPFDQVEREDMFLCKPPFLPLHARRDVISFQTSPLSNSIDVSGVIWVHLYVSSSAPDTDFCVKVIDVLPPNDDFPHGFNMNITHGILRCRYRTSWEKEEMMRKGEVYEIKIQCYPTSNLFQKGHSIRLDISSSNFPHYDINPNTGETFGLSKRWQIAENTVHHSHVYPSHVAFPVVREAQPLQPRHTEWSKLRGVIPFLPNPAKTVAAPPPKALAEEASRSLPVSP